MNLPNELEKMAAERGLWSSGDRIVVAVSGGPDSMALLHMLSVIAKESGLSIIAAHANHGFRIEESAHELLVVQAFAKQLGVICETTCLDMPSYIEETRMKGQAASRVRRYAFLHDVAAKHGASKIALAHHADDQAETVLMRVIRGTGLTGLAGILSKRREKNVELIRPLLRMNKSDLLRYCQEHQIPYCTDSSNNERYYFRNIIRLDILPYLSRHNPQLSQSLQRLAEVAGAEDEWMEKQTEALFAQLVKLSPDECEISCVDLLGLHVALQRRLIKLILSYLSKETENISFEQIETMRLAASTQAPATWRMDAGAGILCAREYGLMRWLRISHPTIHDMSDYALEAGLDTASLTVEQSGWSFQFDYLASQDSRKPASRYEACFDVSKLSYPLIVRNRRPGDRIHVLGLNGSKKVQDMFVDEKIAPLKRELYPLLFDATGRLLWIPGIRRSNFALTELHTKDVLFIRAENE
ncbi:tRNA lysidine(34) synthetase TilS [Paenibacillus sp. FSL H8-0548]|uniref:tRNA lysidine(34) synthetase TilS n=1 Tax=Paenibacillus sp. FSL H8-0548 TaxID=1920422 RepID=UPI00096DBEB7|nr:tRNA lysidine(34) synthetase TilS [Paenibacillus sp. FSL H8-0548]OMF25281.1 tRNA lysidine(34) synthetase TilS [Paenibacillus sp. FSL H8-0548]